MDSQQLNISRPVEERDSNFELLRILSILLIIMHHYSAQGVYGLTQHALTTNKMIEQILSMGGKIGVDCLILITGYFLITSTFKYKKLLKLVLEVFFYSVLFMAIFYSRGMAPYSKKVVIESLFPLTYDMYWYATAYVVLYMLSPFINSFIRGLNGKSLVKLIILLVILWSVLPVLTYGQAPGYSNLGWFILLYLIGAYIKLYPNLYFNRRLINLAVALISFAVMVSSVILFNFKGITISFYADHATYLREMNMFPVLLCSVCLFLFFKNLKIGKNKWINTVAMSTFGVYLIHNNYFVGPYLWEKVFKNTLYLESPSLISHALSTVMIVFCGCTIVDQIRINLFERPLFWLIDRQQKIN